jgi:hypothetical protein
MITSLGKPEREYICRVSVESPTVMANIIEHVTEYHVTKDLSIVWKYLHLQLQENTSPGKYFATASKRRLWNENYEF